jgi:hypothetical protein
MTNFKKWTLSLLATFVATCTASGMVLLASSQTARADEASTQTAEGTSQSQSVQTQSVVMLTKSHGTTNEQVSYSDFLTAVEAIEQDTTAATFTLQLLSDVTINQTATFSKQVTLNLDGYLLRYEAASSDVTISADVTTQEDTATDNADSETTATTNTTPAAVIEVLDGTFTLIDQNTNLQVHLYASEGDPYLFQSGDNPYGFRLWDELEGGTICGGTDSGVKVSGGEFHLQGGNLAGNTSTGNGGGVYVSADGTFIMTGGQIIGNGASIGAGVYTNGYTQIQGGTITDNHAELSSAGVGFGGGTLILSGNPVISQNYLPQNNFLDVEENIALNNFAINVGKMSTGAKIGLTPTDHDPSKDTNVLYGFAENNPNAKPSDYFYSDYMKTEIVGEYHDVVNLEAYKLVIDETSGNVIWKALTLIEKPTTVLSAEFTHEEPLLTTSSTDYTIIGIDETVKGANTYALYYRLTDTENTAWDDGTQGDISIYFVINKRGIIRPEFDESKLVYADGVYTYDTESEWIVAEVSNNTVESGKHMVTFRLAYPNDTYWTTKGEKEADTTANSPVTYTIDKGSSNSVFTWIALGVMIAIVVIILVIVLLPRILRIPRIARHLPPTRNKTKK